MIVSMTGFGKGRSGNKNLSVEAEVKSVNGRYLDISLRIPSSLMNKDYDIKEFIKSKIKRGKVSASIQIKRNGLEEENLALDSDKLKSYLSLLKSIKKAAKISEKVKLEHLLINKEILISNNFIISDVEFNMVKEALEQALTEMMNMKKKEGKELANDLHKRVENIESRLKDIEQDAAQSVKEYFNKFKEKIKTLIENIAQYNDRLELELAIIAEKAEITEESVRLRSHLKFFINSLENDDEPGRKLNFLCQEMNREANTISSKTVSTSITHSTVFIREEIEKIREQIQNIE
ncbi:MAG: YicC family protein [Ignavibacteria bacterium RIFOXYB2_FULL_35_12]|nr:MAG: YicC family protein [Ignavibacteria bacterium GWA2_36_19]OGU50762.1 MAG: YicC family protein [Ignavibacteria bacterium GWC2_35_8]OGU55988.1 MAG: YicC family protein [Ignavibacteria bacterium GWF2_35_20]OGU78540.1 MAG: YicC family protein [Ignavibacteria bacterium RBG_16_35_7]OGU80724.1 MAG: YicC family protein [Ignavibacteria bacterium RIFOXYA2_FULL_35_9]OGU86231.1 MAG: YicC family protein [Ignavibacteria bacterium RIFOXYA12_FULL_35_25]OGU92675.1 MAG: YicC family protein [Ignavibacter